MSDNPLLQQGSAPGATPPPGPPAGAGMRGSAAPPANLLRGPPGPPAPADNPLMSPQAAPALSTGQPYRSREGLEDRISTRIPTSKRLAYDPHETNNLSVGRAAMLPEGFGQHNVAPEHFERSRSMVSDAMRKSAQAIREHYPTIDTHGLNDGGVMERFIEHAHDNLTFLWNKVRNEPWREAAMDWYRGANRLARDLSEQHGVSHRQAAAVLAALSPTKDWYQNANLAERLLKTRAQHQDTAVSPEMKARMQEMVDQRSPNLRPALQRHVDQIPVGTKLKDLSAPEQQALFIRTHDETTNPDRGYHMISPLGERRPAMTKGGKAKTVVWQSIPNVANALAALKDDNLRSISEAMGGNHKVRNFYNNIIAPDAAAFLPTRHHDVTIDTHAINAALMQPMGNKHFQVGHGFGTAGPGSSDITGVGGLYGLHADAVRRAAQTISRSEGRQILPREVQSVTWEAIRNMFEKSHKKADAAGNPLHPVGRAARDAMLAARHGFMPAAMARENIHTAAGGVKAPDWQTGIAAEED
jgi:hypothetical protein